MNYEIVEVVVPEHTVEVEVAVPEADNGLGMFNSLAGTDAQYVGTDEFRARPLGNGAIRIHIRKEVLRDRPAYVAMDLDGADVLKAIALAATLG